jgi:hypothetical protein
MHAWGRNKASWLSTLSKAWDNVTPMYWCMYGYSMRSCSKGAKLQDGEGLRTQQGIMQHFDSVNGGLTLLDFYCPRGKQVVFIAFESYRSREVRLCGYARSRVIFDLDFNLTMRRSKSTPKSIYWLFWNWSPLSALALSEVLNICETSRVALQLLDRGAFGTFVVLEQGKLIDRICFIITWDLWRWNKWTCIYLYFFFQSNSILLWRF